MDKAVGSLDNALRREPIADLDLRTHSTIGLMAFQRCLNCIQVEDLSGAKASLESWTPLDQRPSPMESVVVFRKLLMLGKILRFTGAFEESLPNTAFNILSCFQPSSAFAFQTSHPSSTPCSSVSKPCPSKACLRPMKRLASVLLFACDAPPRPSANSNLWTLRPSSTQQARPSRPLSRNTRAKRSYSCQLVGAMVEGSDWPHHAW